MNISKINIGGTLYDIKDAALTTQVAELIEDISSLTGALKWIGFTSTALFDGSTTNPITIGGQSVTAVAGNVAGYNPTYVDPSIIVEGSYYYASGEYRFYTDTTHTTEITPDVNLVYEDVGDHKRYRYTGTLVDNSKYVQIESYDVSKGLEFVYNGSAWQEFGSTGSLGALAFKDSVEATYTPAGTNSSSAVTFTNPGVETNMDVVDIYGVKSQSVTVYDQATLTPDNNYVVIYGEQDMSELCYVNAVSNGQSDPNYTLLFTSATTAPIGSALSFSSGTAKSVAQVADAATTVATGTLSANGTGDTVVSALPSGGVAAAQTFTGTQATITSR